MFQIKTRIHRQFGRNGAMTNFVIVYHKSKQTEGSALAAILVSIKWTKPNYFFGERFIKVMYI